MSKWNKTKKGEIVYTRNFGRHVTAKVSKCGKTICPNIYPYYSDITIGIGSNNSKDARKKATRIAKEIIAILKLFDMEYYE